MRENYHMINGDSHGRRIMPEPLDSKPEFQKGKNPYKYISYDGHELHLEQMVYRIDLDQNGDPVLKRFIIKDFLHDGQMLVSAPNSTGKNLAVPSQIAVDPSKVLEARILDTKHKIEVELPRTLNQLVSYMKELNPEFNIDSVLVGEGLNDDMEI